MTTPHVEIYTGPMCGFCAAAKHLLKSKSVAFTEYGTVLRAGARSEMIERAGGRTTVPQIFIDGEHVGGCDELYALDDEGTLDTLLGLAGEAAP